MPMFKVKDLMVQIEATGTQALCLHTTFCRGCTIHLSPICPPLTPIGCQPCSLIAISQCPPTTRFCIECSVAITRICPPLTPLDCAPTFLDPLSPIEQLSPIVDTLNHEGLAALKAQLKVVNDKVAEHEIVLDKQFAPQTLEDANLIEEKLNAALKEVQALKGQFRKSSK